MHKAINLRALRRFDEAIECFDKTLVIDPRNSTAWLFKGNSLASLGRFEEAINSYDSALETKPLDSLIQLIQQDKQDAISKSEHACEEATRGRGKVQENEPNDGINQQNKQNTVETMDDPIALFKAISNDQLEAALRFIKVGADVNQKTEWNETPLFIASFKGYTEVVARLLEKGANVNVALIERSNSPGATALHVAAMKGYNEIVSLLLRNCADIDAMLGGLSRDASTAGASPLHLAATHNQIETVRLLVRNGANVKARDDYGSTALHYAVNKMLDEMVRELIRLGADVNAKDNYGRSPLSFAKLSSTIAILRQAGAYA